VKGGGPVEAVNKNKAEDVRAMLYRVTVLYTFFSLFSGLFEEAPGYSPAELP